MSSSLPWWHKGSNWDRWSHGFPQYLILIVVLFGARCLVTVGVRASNPSRRAAPTASTTAPVVTQG